MAGQQNLTIDEERRIREHEAVKDDVRQQVHEEIGRDVRNTPTDHAQEAAAAATLKQKAVSEVAETEHEITRGRTAARGSQFLDYVFYLIYGIVGLATALNAIGARPGAGFTQFVNAIASPFVAPFRGIMHDPAVGSARFMLSYLVALAAYILLHLAINGLLRLFAERKTAI
jgi:hypothetical protein